MAKYTERCPHCGNIVEGVAMRSETHENVRKIVRKGIPETTKFVASTVTTGVVGATTGVVGGKVAGKAVGSGLNYLHNKYKPEIEAGIDKLSDILEDTFMMMDYEFVCPKCGHTWVHNNIECQVNECIEKCVDEIETRIKTKDESIHYSPWIAIGSEVIEIIANALNCNIMDIVYDYPFHSTLKNLGATKKQYLEIKETLENCFEIEFPDDFFDCYMIKEIIDAIYNCKYPHEVSDGDDYYWEDEIDEEEEEYDEEEEYEEEYDEEEYEEYEDEDEEELTSEEQKYIKELRDMLSDGEILPRDRRLLDKIRTQLGISDERATELEESLKSTSLTPEEQEYLDEYKEIVAEGDISARDQKFLNKLKKANGISDERAEELEAMA